jgi:flagellar motility protein MotE (MotC chaperone)
MIRALRDFRIIPIAIVAISCLFVLKSLGLIFDGGYTLGDLGRYADEGDITGTAPQNSETRAPAPAADVQPAPVPARPPQRSWAQQMFNFPEVTGSVPEPKGKQEPAPKGAKTAKAVDPPATPQGTVVPIDGGRLQSPAERALLERLSERRSELDARAKEIEMRETLLLAAEKRLEGRIAQLKQLEEQINDSVRAKDEGEVARFKNVVTMYENMKAKDAARIFDRLEMKVLLEVTTQINPRRMSDILAQMSPDSAERLTVELASRAKDKPPTELPKIEGRPTGN